MIFVSEACNDLIISMEETINHNLQRHLTRCLMPDSTFYPRDLHKVLNIFKSRTIENMRLRDSSLNHLVFWLDLSDNEKRRVFPSQIPGG